MLIRFGTLFVNTDNLVTVSFTDRGVILQLNVAAHVDQVVNEDPRLVVLEGTDGEAARWWFLQHHQPGGEAAM